ncbi:MAG: DUF4446 family protein [Candidatus Nealsonbacteria bacterium]
MFKFLKKQKEPKNLNELLSQFRVLKKDFEKISKEVKGLKRNGKFSIQRVGVVRFNPFKEIGGNQSFSIALLDANNDGVVLTSLYNREGNRFFAKQIKNGQSKYLLSGEEKRAIEQTKSIKV